MGTLCVLRQADERRACRSERNTRRKSEWPGRRDRTARTEPHDAIAAESDSSRFRRSAVGIQNLRISSSVNGDLDPTIHVTSFAQAPAIGSPLSYIKERLTCRNSIVI